MRGRGNSSHCNNYFSSFSVSIKLGARTEIILIGFKLMGSISSTTTCNLQEVNFVNGGKGD